MSERLRSVSRVAVLFVLLWGCSLEMEPQPEAISLEGATDSKDGVEWSTVGVGVTRTTLVTASGSDVLIVFGGYGATDAAAQSWALALADAWFAERGFGEVFAVRGPANASYPVGQQEIQNTRILRALEETAWGGPVRIALVAHSSGAFVADEFIGLLPADLVLGGQPVTVTYYNLDGGALRAESRFSRLAGYFPVYAVARDGNGRTTGESMNASAARSEGERAAAHGLGRALVVDASASGCAAAAGACLHDALITTRPHNPWRFVVALDYTDFTDGRRVVTDYLDQSAGVDPGPEEPVEEADTCTVGGVAGECIDAALCYHGTHQATPGYCPGASNIQCCTPRPASEIETCSVGGVEGQCIATSLCPSSTHVATPGYCPGAANIQCCTLRPPPPPYGPEGAPCGEDSAEVGNDAVERAPSIAGFVGTVLSICETDVDFFSIDLAAGQQVSITAWFEGIDLDVDLEVSSPEGLVVTGYSAELDRETVSLTAPATGQYSVEVYAFTGSGSYTLELSVEP